MRKKAALALLLGIGLFFNLPLLSSAQENWFQNGQNADRILGPNVNSGGASALHHPARVCADAPGRLFAADTRNNRILIWSSIPTSLAAPATVVVGQSDMNSNDSGGGQTGLNWPIGVYSDGTRLFVADTNNNRVLIWNSIPTQNGTPADLVLGQADFNTYTGQPISASSMKWPWDVYYDGSRLYVVDCTFGRVLIWNSLPTSNNQPADVVVGKPSLTSESGTTNNATMATPRGVATNGTALAVCDYNWHRVLLWNTIPTTNGVPADIVLFQPDFDTSSNDYTPMGIYMRGQTLYVACNHNIFVWNSLPTTNNQAADYKIGRFDLQPGLSAEALAAPWGVSTDGTRLYVADTNNSRVMIYNSIPTASDVNANVVLGQQDFTSSVFRSKRGIRSVAGLTSTGHDLVLATHVDNRVVIHDGLPAEDSAEADYIISDVDFDIPPQQFLAPEKQYQVSQMWTDGNRLIAIELSRGIMIWNSFPRSSFDDPDIVIKNTQGAALNNPQGIASDGVRLFVSDTGNNRVLIYNTIPIVDGTAADLVLGQADFNSTSAGLMNYPSRIATDGTRLAVADMEHHRILIWNTTPTQNNQEPDLKLWDGSSDPYRFNLPQGVFIYDSHLFVADSGFNRVLVWNTFPTSITSPNDIVLGQPDMATVRPQKARNRLHGPLNVWFDGDYLWVGEFKFADRVLGYRASISSGAPQAPSSLTATATSAHQIDLTWTDNASNEQGFKMERKTGAGGTYEQIAYLSANTRRYSDRNRASNTLYYYRLRAYNRNGDSGYSNETYAQTPAVNNAPNTPSNPSPGSGQTSINSNPQLSWQGGDPDPGDTVTYDVYFDTVTPPTNKLASNLSNSYLRPSTLSLYTTYYWKVVATDSSAASTEGPIWIFQTWNLTGDYNLILTAGAGGTTFPRPGTYRYQSNDNVSVIANPSANYTFAGWTGDVPSGKETVNPLPLTMNSNKTLAAHFSSSTISLSKTALVFGASKEGYKTSSQQFVISQKTTISSIKIAAFDWSLTCNESWLSCTPLTGSGNAAITASVDPSGLSAGTYTATITITSATATNSPQTVNATLRVYASGADSAPFGYFDTPVNGTSGIEGSVPVTGWALDDIEVTKVDIWRDPVAGEPTHSNGYVYIGDAVFVEGARPDVEAAYATYPLNYQAGWGYMMLTNFLPSQGTGTFRIHAIAHDKEGHSTELGAKTITSDNAHATLPFGAIDTPSQGGTVSGSSYVNFGWALTPVPKSIPTDGSTILVWIDGLPVGHPTYNNYRVDIATLFPGYANSTGAVGYYYLDTTQYANGVHTIAWSVEDSAGKACGIGSRYFTVMNTGGGSAADFGMLSPFSLSLQSKDSYISSMAEVATVLTDYYSPAYVRKGYNLEALPEPIYPDANGVINIEAQEVDRIELELRGSAEDENSVGRSLNSKISAHASDRKFHGYLVVGNEYRPLPIGSTLNPVHGIFSWQLCSGFIGEYIFVFIKHDSKRNNEIRRVRVHILPKDHIK